AGVGVQELAGEGRGVVELVDKGVLRVVRHSRERENQWKYCPPSITIVCPVMKSASGLQRKTTAPTTSSGSWSRWIVRAAIETSRSFSITSGCASTPALIVKPGATQLTWIPSLPSSFASARVSATIAPFEVT